MCEDLHSLAALDHLGVKGRLKVVREHPLGPQNLDFWHVLSAGSMGALQVAEALYNPLRRRLRVESLKSLVCRVPDWDLSFFLKL
jgi:hypothetical protein